MAGITKKPALMASQDFARLFDRASKAALIDALWCACQLGTDETKEQITSQAARNVVIAMETRGDRVPPEIRAASEVQIDSDPF